MDAVRWIVGGSAVLMGTAWLLFFVLGLARDDARQQQAATRLRQWAQLIVMSWFNLEIWGRVVWTLLNWGA